MVISKYQKGITMWGMLVVAMLVIFFAFLAVKLFSPYMTDMQVSSALNSLSKQPDAASMSNYEIKEALDKRFQIDNIDEIVRVRDVVSFSKKGRKRIVNISYESLTPLFSNMSVLIEFDHSAEIGTFGQ